MQTAYLMHGQFGLLDNDNIQKDTRYVYFIRLTEDAVPNFNSYEAAVAEMSDYLLVGSCSSNMLQSLLTLSNEVRQKLSFKSQNQGTNDRKKKQTKCFRLSSL